MNKRAGVFNDGILAGYLEKTQEGEYLFQYDHRYLQDSKTFPISLSLPKKMEPYRSSKLFPFFFGMLSEGINKQTQCRLLKIDENDHFNILLKTAESDTIGAITIKEF